MAFVEHARETAHRPYIPYTIEQQRICTFQTACGQTLFEDGPLVPVTLRGPKGELEGVGLVDTGCGFSCVHEPDAKGLGCPSVCDQVMIGATGQAPMSIYTATLDVFGVQVRELRSFDLEPWRAGMRPDLIAIVGRDVLSHCKFSYDGRGRFKLEVL
jgi:hypothetical protein